jgi:hypothetical protein
MVVMEGGCNRCGMFAYVSKDQLDKHNGKIICFICENNHYSLQSIRDKKLKSLLKKKFWIF